MCNCMEVGVVPVQQKSEASSTIYYNRWFVVSESGY